MSKATPRKDVAIAFLLTGLFLMILALVSMEDSQPEATVPTIPANTSINVLDLVNKHLRDAYDTQEMNRENVEHINAITAPPINEAEGEQPGALFNQLPIDFGSGAPEQLEGQDMNSFAITAVQQRPLSQQIQHEILEDLRRASEETQYRKALAEAIIAKAKNQGYEVQIDDKFKIRNIRKLEPKDGPSIFDPNNIPHR